MIYLLSFGIICLILFVIKITKGIIEVHSDIKREEIAEKKIVDEYTNVDNKELIDILIDKTNIMLPSYHERKYMRSDKRIKQILSLNSNDRIKEIGNWMPSLFFHSKK